jgi:hypothetical protein
VVRELAERRGEVTTTVLREVSERVAGSDLSGFFGRAVFRPAAKGPAS